MKDLFQYYFNNIFIQNNKKKFRRDSIGSKFDRRFYINKLIELDNTLSVKNAENLLFHYNNNINLIDHFINNKDLTSSYIMELNKFYGLVNLKILIQNEDNLLLNLKLKEIVFKPSLNTIQLDFEFQDPIKIYNFLDCPFFKTLKELLLSYYDINKLNHYSIYDSFKVAKKLLRNHSRIKISENDSNLVSELEKIYHFLEINIISPTKTYNVSYKMKAEISAGNRLKPVCELSCLNFTTLTSAELKELKKEYLEFNKLKLDLKYEELSNILDNFKNQIINK